MGMLGLVLRLGWRCSSYKVSRFQSFKVSQLQHFNVSRFEDSTFLPSEHRAGWGSLGRYFFRFVARCGGGTPPRQPAGTPALLFSGGSS